MASATLLDASGHPINSAMIKAEERLVRTTQTINNLKRQLVRAKFDAAQTFIGNMEHWSNADHFGPHSVASLNVRRTLRSRSRYEVIENNPYLKGTILTIANDFVGRGPKLIITDKRISKARRQVIEKKWHAWFKLRRIRQKIWRMRMAKMVDGESFMRAYRNTDRRYPVQLDYQVLETDRISSEHSNPTETREVDGVRFDKFENPLAYHVLFDHPGDSYLSVQPRKLGGDWVDSRFVIHWFRQDRGWLRGIPEFTPSLPLCALLRRYTLAIVRHAETAADLTGIIETDGPGGNEAWTDDAGNIREDFPFDVFPVEAGMIMNLPWGYKMTQLSSVPVGQQYDAFVGSILREITRPILATFNIASGSSKESNMASGVLDTEIYKGGQDAERVDCEEVVLDPMFDLWWAEASLQPETVGDEFFATDRGIRNQGLEHRWNWPKIGKDHTDPAKVAQALQIMHDKRFLTDEDIQNSEFNRDVEDWQEQVAADDKFRESLPSVKAERKAETAKANPQKPGAKSNNRNRAKSSQPRKASAK